MSPCTGLTRPVWGAKALLYEISIFVLEVLSIKYLSLTNKTSVHKAYIYETLNVTIQSNSTHRNIRAQSMYETNGLSF